MCNFFVQGKCTKGDKCTYAHGDAELGTAINIENLPADQRVNTYDPSNPADRQAGFGELLCAAIRNDDCAQRLPSYCSTQALRKSSQLGIAVARA